jgi:aspartate racemase
MKTIGLIGGMSWESSAEYYRLINRAVNARLGGQHSARLVLASVDFHEVAAAQHDDDWDRAALPVVDAAQRLERAGADFALLCTNTMHSILDRVQRATPLPFLHLADATAERAVAAGFTRVGLLGTRFTMEKAFYRDRLAAHGLESIVPGADDRNTVHRVIYDELCRGNVSEASRAAYSAIVRRLADAGAQAAILGCTEITLLVRAQDSVLPLLDTTRIHVEAAVDRALASL